jgi:hypothetical protein
MRRSQTKPDQLDLFGSTGRPCSLQTPRWQTLPRPARRKITELMARLLMEHGANQAFGTREETGDINQSVESDDV